MSYLQDEFDQGLALFRQQGLRNAERLFENVLEIEPDHFEALHLLGIICRETDRPERAVELIERAVGINPKSPVAYTDLALTQLDIARPFGALASCDRAILLDPAYADAHRVRGKALLQLKLPENALISLDKSLALEAGVASAHHLRAIALLRSGRAEEAVGNCDRALALDPNLAEAHDTAGTAYLERRRFAEALARYDAALSLDPFLASAHWNRSLCLLQTGHLDQGFREYEWRKKLRPPIASRSYAQPLWTGAENIVGKTLFIYWEQGLGDTLQFYRYAKLVAAQGTRVVMSVQDPLVELLQASAPEIQVLRSTETPAAFDFHSPLLSLAAAFQTTLATIPSECPYIASNRGSRIAWSSRLPPKTRLRIGVVWSGAIRHANDENRSIPLERLLPLLGEDADWMCLQTGLTGKDVGLLRQLGHVAYFGDEIKSFADTAALIDLMDLVITVDTSVGHLAGAMGKPVWLMLPYNSDWRWLLDRDASPWYPSARLYRQQRPGEWDTLIDQIRRTFPAARATRFFD